jgi:hypothetical protein
MSSSPRHELTSAINHLQSAASHFEEKALRESRSSWIKVAGRYEKVRIEYIDRAVDAFRKAANCYAIIASIYSGLGEYQLTAKYADLLKVAFYLTLAPRGFYDRSAQIDEAELLQLLGLLSKLGPDNVKTGADAMASVRIISLPGQGIDSALDNLVTSKAEALLPPDFPR